MIYSITLHTALLLEKKVYNVDAVSLHIHSQCNKEDEVQWMYWHFERRKLYHCEGLDL